MKIRIIFFTLFFSLFSCYYSYSQQITVLKDAEKFITSVQTMFNATGENQAIQAGLNLEKTWKKLNVTQQQELIELSSQMAKSYKLSPHFLLLYEGLFYLFENKWDKYASSYIETISKMVLLGDQANTSRWINHLNWLFTQKLLFVSNQNKVYLLPNSDFELRFESNKPEVTMIKDLDVFENLENWETAFSETKKTFNYGIEASVGAYILLKKANFALVTASDSIVVENTNALLNSKESIIIGKEGEVDWSVLNSKDIRAIFSSYAVSLKQSRIWSAETRLENPKKLSQAIKGSFLFISKKRPPQVRGLYPRFISHTSDAQLTIPLQCKAGYTLIGLNSYTSAKDKSLTNIILREKEKILFTSSGVKYFLGDSSITSSNATFKGYLETGDSLQHPALRLDYFFNQKKIRTQKIESSAYSNTPFSNSFHKIYITANAFEWRILEKRMDFFILSGKSVIPVLFESFDYFDPAKFRQLGSYFGFHPIQVILNYLKTQNKSSATAEEVAAANQRPVESIKNAFNEMVQKQFFEYHEERKLYKLSEKGAHSVASFTNKKDYDTFIISSLYMNSRKDTLLSSATIQLATNLLTIRGIRQFFCSDSLDISFIPENNEIYMTKGRSFTFTGQTRTQNYRFYGQNTAFDYDKFEVNLPKIDSITFTPKPLWRKGIRVQIGGDLKYKSGTLFINKPNNKSGREKREEYPRLLIPEGVTAYFDHPYRQNGVYTKEKVYFKVPKIDYDSLSKRDIELIGKFYSNGMFPDFDEKLVAMPDYTLGFVHKSKVYPVYNSNSFFKMEESLVLDKKGIYSKGELKHIAATLQTEKITFFPDSVRADGKIGLIQSIELQGVYFPNVAIKTYNLLWTPARDSLTLYAAKEPFSFYENSALLEGELVIRKTGLFGLGHFKRTDSDAFSTLYAFFKEGFQSPKGDFRVGQNLHTDAPAFFSKNSKLIFNVLKNIVSFEKSENLTEKDTFMLEFSHSSYRTNSQKSVWDINNKTVSVEGDEHSSYWSLIPEHLGISIKAKNALFEVTKMLLNLENVAFIPSAEAKIIPHQNKVTIRKGGEIAPLYNAVIKIDTLGVNHLLMDSYVKINSLKQFEGNGTYIFMRAKDDTARIKMESFQQIEEILPDKKTKVYQTTAQALITEAQQFKITPRLKFKGQVTFWARRNSLEFDGFLRLIVGKRKSFNAGWITYKSQQGDQNINIVVDKNLKGEGGDLTAGIHYAESGLYTTFLSPKLLPEDQNITLAEGNLFDKDSYFELKNTKDRSLFVFNDANGTVYQEGKINLFSDEKHMISSGICEMSLDSITYEANTLTKIDFPLVPEAVLLLAQRVVKANLVARFKSVSQSSSYVFSKLGYLLGEKFIKENKEKIKTVSVSAVNSLSPKSENLFTFSDVDWRWSGQQNAFYTVGDLGVATIGNTEINGRIKGYIEIQKNGNQEDYLSIYLEPIPDVWYYFNFQNDELGVISSQNDFNQSILAKIPKKEGKKNDKKKEYKFVMLDGDERMTFLQRFQRLYPQTKPKTWEKQKLSVEESTIQQKKSDGF